MPLNKANLRFYLIFIAGVIIWLISAFFSDGFFQADEHFQIIEFANYKLGNIPAVLLPWEFSEQMRPGLQPMITFAMIKFLSWLGVSNPFTQIMVLRLLTAMLAVVAMAYAFKQMRCYYASLKSQTVLLLLFFFLWFFPLLVVRFSSENLSAIFILLVASLFLKEKGQIKTKHFLWGGLAAGLAFLFRYQSAVMIVGIVFWMLIVLKPGLKKIVGFIAVFLFICAIGFLPDRWLYGDWVCAPWNYFRINLLQDKLSSFGIKPWHHYFTAGSELLFVPIGILIWLSVAVYWVKRFRSPLTWISLPFVVFHVLLAHKEVRFLFPLLFFVPVFIIELLQWISKWKLFRNHALQYALLFGFFVINLIIIALFISKPMDQYVGVMQQIEASPSQQKLLFYTHADPQSPAGLPPYFYKDTSVISTKLNDSLWNHIPLSNGDTTVFVYEEMKGSDQRSNEKFEAVQFKFPPWLRTFNVANWQQRTSNWALYTTKSK